MLSRIVVGVDFSPESDAAVAQAMAIARRSSASLVLLHVGAIPTAPDDLPKTMEATAAAYVDVVTERLDEDRAALEALRERLAGQGVEVSHAVYDGFAETGIVEAAEELHADLIVVGTHGRTGIKRFFLGSVAERAARLARVPILVARPGQRTPAEGLQNILVATDFSASAAGALVLAQALASEGAVIRVLHVWQLPPMSAARAAPPRGTSDPLADLHTSMAASVAQTGAEWVARHAGGGVRLIFEAAEGTPAHVIQEAIATHEPDVVLLGSHGRRAVTRFLLGSVAENTVRYAPCSVVVVHGAVGTGQTGSHPA